VVILEVIIAFAVRGYVEKFNMIPETFDENTDCNNYEYSYNCYE